MFALQYVSSLPLPSNLLLRRTPYALTDSPVLQRKRPLARPRLSVSLFQRGNYALRAQPDIKAGEEDTDEDVDEEELDALFDELGQVVLADSNARPPSAEVDDDSQSLAFAVALAEVANDVKAVEIKVLHVKPLVYWTRFFVIATAFSRPQLDAIGKRMRDIAVERFESPPRGDTRPNSWTLLDFGDVVVHLFLPKERAHYNLEEFYGNATSIDLPFQTPRTPTLG